MRCQGVFKMTCPSLAREEDSLPSGDASVPSNVDDGWTMDDLDEV